MILYVIDGTKPTIEIKGWLEASDDTPIRISSDRDAFSVIRCVGDCASYVREFDIIKIEHKGVVYWGGVVEASLTKKGQAIVEITFGMLLDFYNLDVDKHATTLASLSGRVNKILTYWFNSSFKYNAFEWAVPIRRDETTTDVSGSFYFQDSQLPLNQAVRQLYKQGIRPKFIINTNTIKIDLDSEKLNDIEINLEDTLDYNISLKNDTFNVIKPLIKVKSGEQDYVAKRFLGTDGIVRDAITDINQVTLPMKVVIQEFEAENFSSINYNEIDNVLKSQSYGNSASIKISKDYFFFGIFDKNLMRNIGRECTLYLNEYDIKLRSVINEIEVVGDVINITLGLSQTRLFDRISRRY